MKYIFPVYCDSVPVVNGKWADSRCCSVMALVHAFGISFEEAQKHTAEFGRKVHEGMALDDLILMLYAKFSVHMGVTYGGTDRSWLFNEIHFNIHEEYPKSKKGCTLETFMKNNPKGRYIVFLKGHVTVVSPGKLLDYNRQKGAKRVYHAIKVGD
jgi:hypothetical protein